MTETALLHGDDGRYDGMSPLDRTGRNYADDLFNKRMEHLAVETSQKTAAIYAEHARRNTLTSGMHMTDHAKVLVDKIRLLAEARAETLLTAYNEGGISVDDASIAKITAEVEQFCRAQQLNAAEAMRLVIRQTFQGNTPPNLEKAVIEEMETHINRAGVEIARDLRIKKSQAELARSRDTREVQARPVGGQDKVWDVFICHASEDKDSFVRPLAVELNKTIRVWYDEFTLTVGDSLRQKIDEGLAKSRYGIVVLSEAFFAKNWPQAELDGLMSREMAGTHIKVILPVWHKVRRDDVLGYSPILADRLAAESKDGILEVVTKLHVAMNQSPTPALHSQTWREVDSETSEYYEQRRQLPDNAVFNAIVAKPHWRISMFPIVFKKARFRDLEQCKSFVSASSVRMPSGIPYPQIWPDTVETGREYVGCDTNPAKWPPTRAERWVLFRSALFVQNRVFNEANQLSGRIHVLEILDIATAALEFAASMTQHAVLAPEIAITIGLHAVEGKQVTWPQAITLDNDTVPRNCWCQDAKIDLSRRISTTEIKRFRREIAFGLAIEIYSGFGWSDPPTDHLRREQMSRFGSV